MKQALPGEMYRTPKVRSPALLIAVGTGSILLIAALILPLFALMNQDVSDAEIVRLSNIGQAYGVASAVLSAAALLALAGSIAYQAKQRRDDRIVTWRSAQESLLRLAIDDPETYAPCIMNVEDFEDMEQIKRHLFTTLWLGYGRAGIYLGYITETDLRTELLKDTFSSPVGRELWRLRKERIVQAGRDGPWFERVVEEEYARAVAVMPRPESRSGASDNSPSENAKGSNVAE
jgi:hypothetical protein